MTDEIKKRLLWYYGFFVHWKSNTVENTKLQLLRIMPCILIMRYSCRVASYIISSYKKSDAILTTNIYCLTKKDLNSNLSILYNYAR